MELLLHNDSMKPVACRKYRSQNGMLRDTSGEAVSGETEDTNIPGAAAKWST